MAKIKFVTMILILFALLAGCNGNLTDTLDFNLFTALGVVTPTLKTAPATVEPTTAAQAETLVTLSADLSSPAYLAELTNPDNPEAVAALATVETYLVGVYSQTATSTQEEAVVQEAAVLYANLNLDTTGGTTVVQNVVATLMNSSGLDVATEAGVSTLVKSLLPETVNSTDTFQAMVAGMVSANDAYTAFAGTLPTGLTAETAASVTVAGDVNMGDVAQKALVSFVVSNVVDLWLPTGTTAETATSADIADAAGHLWDFLQDSTNSSAQPTGNVSTVLDTTTAGFTGVSSLFLVAGLDLGSFGMK